MKSCMGHLDELSTRKIMFVVSTYISIQQSIIGKVLLIFFSIMFRVCSSVCKSCVGAYGCLLIIWLTEEYKAVENTDRVRKHCSEFDKLYLRFMDPKLQSQWYLSHRFAA